MGFLCCGGGGGEIVVGVPSFHGRRSLLGKYQSIDPGYFSETIFGKGINNNTCLHDLGQLFLVLVGSGGRVLRCLCGPSGKCDMYIYIYQARECVIYCKRKKILSYFFARFGNRAAMWKVFFNRLLTALAFTDATSIALFVADGLRRNFGFASILHLVRS